MSQNGFKDYLVNIGKYPLLTAAEEVELGKMIKEGTEVQKQRAINKLAMHNTRLVVRIAKQYNNNYVHLEDLVQEGNIGLLKAAAQFDYELGYRFTTYASYWIEQSIRKAIATNGRKVRLPIYVVQMISKINKYIDDYEQANDGVKPTNAQIAAHFNIDEEKVKNYKKYNADAISSNTSVGDDEKVTIEDLVGDESDVPTDVLNQKDIVEAVEKGMSDLPERTQKIIRYRYGLVDGIYHTLEETGDYIGLTRERVRQIDKETCLLLKSRLGKIK